MLLVDTTVLAYAVGDPSHPLSAPAKALVRDVARGVVRATTTPEVIQEFMHVHVRRRPRELVRQRAQHFAELFSPLHTVDEGAILRMMEEFEQRPTIGAFDAVLVAIVQGRDDLELVTADRALLALDDVPVRALDSFVP